MNPNSGELDGVVAALLTEAATASLPELDEIPVEQARKTYVDSAKAMAGQIVEVRNTANLSVKCATHAIPIRYYSTRAAGDEPEPALIYLHGGGWVIGNLDSHDNLCRSICTQSGCAVIAVDYRLAPEHPFPAGAEDALKVTSWLQDNAAQLNVDPNRIAVGGDSAGGNLAATVSYLLQQEQRALPRFQMLLYPATDLTMSFPSIDKLATGYRLTKSMISWFVGQYLEDRHDRMDLRASPILNDDLNGHPPTLIITAGFDPLRDEGKAYADRLTAAGVPTQYRCYEDMIHGFMNMSGILPQARSAVSFASDALRQALTPTERSAEPRQ